MDITYQNATKNFELHEERIRESHKHCANMRTSRSMTSSCLRVKEKDTDTVMYFPVSVCCTSDLCFMSREENNKFAYTCNNENECFLLKDLEIVQALPKGSSTLEECVNNYSNKDGNNQNLQFDPDLNIGFYYNFTSEALRQNICKENKVD